MFQKAKNMDTAFRQIRTFSLVVVILCGLICCYSMYISYRQQTLIASRIYVLANGKALQAFASGRAENIPVEARDHVKTFHEYFFTLDPDEKVIRSNISKALYLADGSAKDLYESLKENNYYTGIISGNVSQHLITDSVIVHTNAYPYYFRYYGKETITRPSTITTRSLITEGYLRNVERSDNNPHGFLIERWVTLENKDLKTVNR